MAHQNATDDACNLEVSMHSEPTLEISQDLELLAQEIAEAAVEEERRFSNASSPTPSSLSRLSDDGTAEDLTEMVPEAVIEEEEEEEEESSEEEEEEDEDDADQENQSINETGRSQSPVDEASWEIVDAEDDTKSYADEKEDIQEAPEQNYSIVRKFLGSQDLLQKLKDIGMVCDMCGEQSMESDSANTSGISNMVVSCSESMVICDMPQDGEQEDRGDDQQQSQLTNMTTTLTLPTWQGRIAGAMVVIELERLGGLLVASVKVNHTDLLSALTSLQQLAASAVVPSNNVDKGKHQTLREMNPRTALRCVHTGDNSSPDNGT